jgi:hypothetical protein
VLDRRASSFQGVAVLPGSAADTRWLYTGSDNGSVMRYLYADGRLVMDRQVVQDEPQVKVIGTGDFLPESGSEVFLSIPTTGTLTALSGRLDELSDAGLDSGRVAAARADLSAKFAAGRRPRPVPLPGNHGALGRRNHPGRLAPR